MERLYPEKPLCIDLYAGLGGWAEGFLAEGHEVHGYDIEAHDYGTGGYPAKLHLRDVLTIHGSEFKDAACIVASPPCQEYSYMAMPWSRGKQIAAALRGKGEFPEGYTGSRTIADLNRLFEACFRIQREASEAAGRRIPMVVENVRGAQTWVGEAPANYGSFYLWGDVGMVGRRVVCVVDGKVIGGRGVAPAAKGQKFNPDGTAHPTGSWFAVANSMNRGANAEKVPGFRFDGSGKTFQTASVDSIKTPGRSMSKGALKWGPHNMGPSVAMMAELGVKQGGNWFHDSSPGTLRSFSGTKQAGLSGVRKNGKGNKWFQDGATAHGSRSQARKAASAMIAKIPFPLASHIARVFKP